MSTPLFANSWYGKLPVDEVRKEVQALYDGITALEAGEVDLSGYYTSAEVDALLASKSDVGHTHLAADVTDLASYTGFDARYYTEAEVTALLAGKSNTGHTHSTSDITNLSSYTGLDSRYYTESEVNALLSGYLPLTGGTLTGSLAVLSAAVPPFYVQDGGSGNQAQLIGGTASNEAYFRNALSGGTVDGSIIIDGANDRPVFRPGDTGGARHEMWHNGNTPITSNSNGVSLRLTNGIQICWQRAAPSIAISTSSSKGGFLSAEQTWTFPQAFNADPYVFGSLEAEAGVSINVNRFSTSSARWRLRAITSQSAATTVVYLLAVGTWA